MVLLAPTTNNRQLILDPLSNKKPPEAAFWHQDVMRRTLASVILSSTNFDSIQLRALSSLSDIVSEYLRTLCNLLKLEVEKNGRSEVSLTDFYILTKTKTVDFDSLLFWIKSIKQKPPFIQPPQDFPSVLNTINPFASLEDSAFLKHETDNTFFLNGATGAQLEFSGLTTKPTTSLNSAVLSNIQESDCDMLSVSPPFENSDETFSDSESESDSSICDKFSSLFYRETSTENVENFLKETLDFSISENLSPDINADYNTNNELAKQLQEIKINSSENLVGIDHSTQIGDLASYNDEESTSSPSCIKNNEIATNSDEYFSEDQNNSLLPKENDYDYALSMFQSPITDFEDMGISLSDLNFDRIKVSISQQSTNIQSYRYSERSLLTELDLGIENIGQNKIDRYIASLPDPQQSNFGDIFMQDQELTNFSKKTTFVNSNTIDNIDNNMVIDSDISVPIGAKLIYNQDEFSDATTPLFPNGKNHQMDIDFPIDFTHASNTRIESANQNISFSQNQNHDTITEITGKKSNELKHQLEYKSIDKTKPESHNILPKENLEGAALGKNDQSKVLKLDHNYYALKLLEMLDDAEFTNKSYFAELLTNSMKEKLLTVEADDLGLPQPSLYIFDESIDKVNIFDKCLAQWIESTFDRENLVKIMDYKMQVMEAKSGKEAETNSETITPAESLDLTQKRTPYAGGIIQDGVYQLHDRISLCAHGFRDGVAQTVTGSVTQSVSGIASNR
ncbi:hypothetical protein BB561_001102 [Smittium simulii]|uniref:Bromodomain associated domain-containing protein n=1 Tax=Smittium simulii TaxID=133385 RepID=A0A2T9YW43_9FUNG|nr:hypothetical protein BB561_001102 [Smittium simulii]